LAIFVEEKMKNSFFGIKEQREKYYLGGGEVGDFVWFGWKFVEEKKKPNVFLSA